MKFQIYRKGRSRPRLGLAVSLPSGGEIDLPYMSDEAFEKLTVPVDHRQLAAIVDRDEPPPPELSAQVIEKSAWWLQIQTEVLYGQWPRQTLAMLKAAYEVLRAEDVAA